MKSKRPIHATLLATLAIALCGILLGSTSCQPSGTHYLRESGERFHTFYHITYQHEEPLTEAIDSLFDAFNAVLNPFDSTSLVAQINRNKSDQLHPMLLEVISKATEVSQLTGGHYDITGAPLFNIWGFGTKKGVTREATPEEIDSIKSFVGYEKIRLIPEEGRIEKSDSRLELNPSSLSKGYVVDLVGKLLEEKGVENYMVEIGGEIVAKGLNPSGKCWRVGINQPIEDNSSTQNEILYAIELCEKRGMASSGDYRNYKILNGRKVAHTIDVVTGYPAHQDILSATIIAPTSMEADAWATAFMALGLERSKELLEQLPQLSACFIYADSETGELTTYQKGIDLIPLD